MRQGDKVILRSDEALHALEHGLHRLEEAAVDWFCAEKAPEDSDEPTQEELEAMDELSNAACFVGVCSLYLDHLDEHPEDDVKVKS